MRVTPVGPAKSQPPVKGCAGWKSGFFTGGMDQVRFFFRRPGLSLLKATPQVFRNLSRGLFLKDGGHGNSTRRAVCLRRVLFLKEAGTETGRAREKDAPPTASLTSVKGRGGGGRERG